MVEYKTYMNLCEERDKLREALGVAKEALKRCDKSQYQTVIINNGYSAAAYYWLNENLIPWKIAKQALARIEEIMK